MPALHHSAARLPPPPPAPTMTTSVVAVAISGPPRRGGVETDDAGAGEGVLAREICRREGGLCAGETDQAPAGEVLVPAVDRIGKHAFHGVSAQSVEEFTRRRVG